ncbi:hypothetical protein KCU71_g1592, partial [Aureobasidium melanogenum]
MSGAEAIAIIPLIEACIDITKAIIKIGEAAKSASGLPKDLAGLFAEFPTVQALFERGQKKARTTSEDERSTIAPVLENCEKNLEKLQALFEKVCPRDDANHVKRVWKSTKASVLGRNSELQSLWKKVVHDLNLLEKKHILDIGDKLEGMSGKVDKLAEDEEKSRVSNYGSGPLIHTEGGNSFSQGGGEHNQYTQNNHGT